MSGNPVSLQSIDLDSALVPAMSLINLFTCFNAHSHVQTEESMSEASLSAATQPESQVEDDQSTDGLKSSYYFFKSTDPQKLKEFLPKELDSTAAAQAATPTDGRSSWNTAGTFEEKDLSKWAHDRIKSLFTGAELSGLANSGTGTIKEVSKVSGDSSVVFTRGKKRYGFDLEVQLSVEAKFGEQNASATIDFKLEDTDEDEYEPRISAVKGTAADSLKSYLRKWTEGDMVKMIQTFLAELRQQ